MTKRFHSHSLCSLVLNLIQDSEHLRNCSLSLPQNCKTFFPISFCLLSSYRSLFCIVAAQCPHGCRQRKSRSGSLICQGFNKLWGPTAQSGNLCRVRFGLGHNSSYLNILGISVWACWAESLEFHIFSLGKSSEVRKIIVPICREHAVSFLNCKPLFVVTPLFIADEL